MVEFRDPAEKILDQLEAEIHAAIAQADGEKGVVANVERLICIPPAAMDAEIAAFIEAAAHKHQAPAIRSLFTFHPRGYLE